jgi:large subunit ribosomal protein L13
MYTPHIDCGDYVIVINSDELVVSGEKLSKKKYYRHSQYPGSLKKSSLQEMIDKDSTKAVELAIKRMLPDNKLRTQRISRLKIYKDAEHENSAQKPQELTLEGAKS